MATKEQEVFQVAQELYRQNPDWVTFFRVVLGLDGVVRQAFPTTADMDCFATTDEYQRLQQMLADLRRKTKPVPTDEEPTTVITVRLPKSLHDTLKTEAHEHRTSMNKLCIAKLLQALDAMLTPAELAAAEAAADQAESREYAQAGG
jgi:hypothetical protein